MKTLFLVLALASIPCMGFVASPSHSSFAEVDQAQAATISGGCCWHTVPAGCMPVIAHCYNPETGDYCYHQLDPNRPGCNDAIDGTDVSRPCGPFKDWGYGKWCDSDETWACGLAIVFREECYGGFSVPPDGLIAAGRGN